SLPDSIDARLLQTILFVSVVDPFFVGLIRVQNLDKSAGLPSFFVDIHAAAKPQGTIGAFQYRPVIYSPGELMKMDLMPPVIFKISNSSYSGIASERPDFTT